MSCSVFSFFITLILVLILILSNILYYHWRIIIIYAFLLFYDIRIIIGIRALRRIS